MKHYKKRKTRNLFLDNQGRWVIDFTVQGKRIIRIIGPSKTEAIIALETLRADVRAGKYQPQKKEGPELFEDWAQEIAKTRSHLNSLRNLLRFFKGCPLEAIRPFHVERFKESRLAEGVSPASINRELAFLKFALNKAVENDLIQANPIGGKRVLKLKEAPPRERILSDAEEMRLIEAAAPGLQPMLLIALNTGLRKMELLSLKWGYIDLQRRFITVPVTKNGHPRSVPMNQVVINAIRGLPRSGEYLFPNPGTRSHISSIKRSFASACRRAGIKNMRLHDLRHTFASKYIEHGGDLVALSKILGHSSLSMTMRYAHPVSETMLRGVDSMASRYQKEASELGQTRKKDETQLSPGGEVDHRQILCF